MATQRSGRIHKTLLTWKYRVAERVKQNPLLWYLTVDLVGRVPALLPHEKSYFGLRHLTSDKKGLLLDVGANNGMSALGFRAVGIDYDFLSIEINPYHRKALERVKKRLPRFEYKIVGAGEAETRLKLYTPIYKGIPIHAIASVDFEHAKEAVARDFSKNTVRKMKYHEQTVDIIRLDTLFLKPDIIKIDAEGYDYAVLKGLCNTITETRPYLLIEFTPMQFAQTLEFTDKTNYALFLYEEASDTFSPFDEDTACKTYSESALQVNLFGLPKEKVQERLDKGFPLES